MVPEQGNKLCNLFRYHLTLLESGFLLLTFNYRHFPDDEHLLLKLRLLCVIYSILRREKQDKCEGVSPLHQVLL